MKDFQPKSLTKNLCIPGPAGKLESILFTQENPKFLAVISHPHPQYKGTMHNKVVVTAAKTLRELGGAVLRFNFRGVMASDGEYGEGITEEADVDAAIDFINAEYYQHRVPLIVGGFSFGAWVGLKHGAKDSRVNFLIGLGLPIRMFSTKTFMNTQKPKLIVWGENDELCPIEDIQLFSKALSLPKTIYVVPEADHFFTDKLNQVAGHIEKWVKGELNI